MNGAKPRLKLVLGPQVLVQIFTERSHGFVIKDDEGENPLPPFSFYFSVLIDCKLFVGRSWKLGAKSVEEREDWMSWIRAVAMFGK